jgi:hypothetical protein
MTAAMEIRSSAAFLQAISRASEPRPAAFADRLAELQGIARAAKAANAAHVAALRAPAAAAAAGQQQPQQQQAAGGSPAASLGAPIKPRGSLLNIVV